jgi:hypothetical protein
MLYSCTESKINTKSEIDTTSITLKTSNKSDVKKMLRDRSLRKNDDSLFQAYPQFMKEIPLQGTDAKITSVPVLLKDKNTYSRLFSIDINDEQQNVIYNMIPEDTTSTSTAFTGKVIVTDMEGNMKSFIKVAKNEFEKITLLDSIHIHNINDLDYTTYSGCEGCPFHPCSLCDLGEVVVVSDPPPVYFFYFGGRMNVPEITPGESEGWPPPLPQNGGGGGTADGDDFNDSCPPDMIEDASGNCIDTCDDDFIMNDDGDCVQDCPPGYKLDKDGYCKEEPCQGDPIKNPTVAAQTDSGLDGGRFGCTRNGGGCEGQPNKKKHGGLDVLNPYGAPVFAMFDGTATAVEKFYDEAGWIVYQTAVVDGESISIQYFHLQEPDRITGSVSAGDIVGYQGDSGNLEGAIEGNYCESHVHVKIKNSSGEVIDPEDYFSNLNTAPDENPEIIDTSCN